MAVADACGLTGMARQSMQAPVSVRRMCARQTPDHAARVGWRIAEESVRRRPRQHQNKNGGGAGGKHSQERCTVDRHVPDRLLEQGQGLEALQT